MLIGDNDELIGWVKFCIMTHRDVMEHTPLTVAAVVAAVVESRRVERLFEFD